MTLEEAILHCEEVAKDNFNRRDDKKCIKCGYEHIQLAEWLKELKNYREMNQEENYMESNDTVKLMNSSNWKDKEGKPPMVEHPSYYISGKYECIDVMRDIFGDEPVEYFCLLEAFKYLYRCRYKDSYKDDLRKAKRYIEMILEEYGG